MEGALKSLLPHPWLLSNSIGHLARLDNGKNGILPLFTKNFSPFCHLGGTFSTSKIPSNSFYLLSLPSTPPGNNWKKIFFSRESFFFIFVWGGGASIFDAWSPPAQISQILPSRVCPSLPPPPHISFYPLFSINVVGHTFQCIAKFDLLLNVTLL